MVNMNITMNTISSSSCNTMNMNITMNTISSSSCNMQYANFFLLSRNVEELKAYGLIPPTLPSLAISQYL